MLGEPTLLAGVGVVRNHVVAPGKGRLDVDLRCRRRLVRAAHGLPRSQQRLGRDARPVGATRHRPARARRVRRSSARAYPSCGASKARATYGKSPVLARQAHHFWNCRHGRRALSQARATTLEGSEAGQQTVSQKETNGTTSIAFRFSRCDGPRAPHPARRLHSGHWLYRQSPTNWRECGTHR